MADKSLTVDRQIALLQHRNVEFEDVEKAKEILMDIGYYRLGFYFFPFEKTFPALYQKRKHVMQIGTKFEDAVALYYFDFDLRILLLKYTSRIEVAFRTCVVYNMSNRYDNPCWFVDAGIMSPSFIKDFRNKVYVNIKRNPAIVRHHQLHKRSKFAPAWKTLEFMTLGEIQTLFENIIKVDDQLIICKAFHVNKTQVFLNYIDTVRHLRNICAHGGVLYEMKLTQAIRKGPAGHFQGIEKNFLYGTLVVAHFMLEQISENRAQDMWNQVCHLLTDLCQNHPNLQSVIENTMGAKVEDFLKLQK